MKGEHLVQVRVGIDKAGAEVATPGVDHPGIWSGLEVRLVADLRYVPIPDSDRTAFIDGVGEDVDDPPLPDDRIGCFFASCRTKKPAEHLLLHPFLL